MVTIASHGDDDCVSCYVNEILDCYHKLSQSPDLKPSQNINCLFERLVALCSQIPHEAITSQVCQTGYSPTIVPHINEKQVLSDPKVVDIAPHLRELCSDGEYQLEAHWARKVCCCKTHEEGGYPFTSSYLIKH